MSAHAMIDTSRVRASSEVGTPAQEPAFTRFVERIESDGLFERGHPLLVGIDLNALKQNCRLIRASLGLRQLCAVLKGDAYGHGIRHVAGTVVEHCRAVAVTDNAEAAAIREQSSEVEIIRLRTGADHEIAAAMRRGLNVTEQVGSFAKCQEIHSLARSAGWIAPLHLSLDAAGLGRGGYPCHDMADVERFIEYVVGLPNVEITSLACHLPDAARAVTGDPSDSTRQAIELFKTLAVRAAAVIERAGQPLPTLSVFSSASSGAFGALDLLEDTGLDLMDRIGNGLLGIPNYGPSFTQGTRQVMHAAATVTDVIWRPFGASIGYEHAYTVDNFAGENVALLNYGWMSAGREYQGVGKTDSSAFVLTPRGQAHEVLGRQSMNITTVAADTLDGLRLQSGNLVLVTTDWGALGGAPTLHLLSTLMGGVQTEYVSTSLGSSPSSMRFVF